MKLLVWSSGFTRAFRRVVRRQPGLRDRIEGALRQLAEDPFHPSLHSHKLKGELAGVWACTVGYDSRLFFEFVQRPESGEREILLLAIGTHDEVYWKSCKFLGFMSDSAIRVENLGEMCPSMEFMVSVADPLRAGRIVAEKQRSQNLWQTARQLAASPFGYLRRIIRSPSMAADAEGRVYVLWSQSPEETSPGEALYYVRGEGIAGDASGGSGGTADDGRWMDSTAVLRSPSGRAAIIGSDWGFAARGLEQWRRDLLQSRLRPRRPDRQWVEQALGTAHAGRGRELARHPGRSGLGAARGLRRAGERVARV